jgi:ABC-2 type transport system permease protein
MVSLAVKFGSNAENSGRRLGSGSLDLVGLATSGAANFTVTMFFFAAGFLLLVIVALFCGDTVASEASWSSLRYLLAAPIPRRRLLKQKLIVGLVLSLGAIATLPVVSFIIGLIAFGNGPLNSPLGVTFSPGEALWRIAAIGLYIFISLLFAAGIAFLMSVLTDAPLGAVGAAVVLVIISNVLNAIDALGSLREWLPTHYSQAWIDLMSSDVDWTNMARGASYSIVACSIFVSIAVYRFDRKDIVS